MQPATDRRGMMLPIAMAIMVVLSLVTLAVYTLRQQTYRGLSLIDGYLDAVAVGEACFVEIVERLGATKWSERWFKSGPASGDGTFMEGSYDYVIADAPRLGEADLVVWARNADSEVTMHWRLMVDPYNLSPYREIRTIYFGYGKQALKAPGGGLAELVASLGPALEEREANQPWAEDLQARVLGSEPGAIPSVLGIPAQGMILEEIPSPTRGGTPRRIEPGEIGRAVSELDPPGGPPVPPGAPTPTPAPGSPATPTTSVALADSIAQVAEVELQYDQALDFLQNALQKLGQLEGPLNMASSLGIPGASTCRQAYNTVVNQTQSTLSSVQSSQQELSAMERRANAAAGPPAPSQEQAQQQSQEIQDLLARTPDPCDSVNQLVRNAERAVQDCATVAAPFGDLIQEMREEVQGLRGRNGNCQP